MDSQATASREQPLVDPSLTWKEYDRGVLTETGIAMNSTAAFVFKFCDGSHTVDEIADAYSAKFGISGEMARDDVNSVIDLLRKQKILVAK